MSAATGPEKSGPTYNDIARATAQLTTERNDANERLIAWFGFRRKLEILRLLYANDPVEGDLIAWVTSGQKGAQGRIDELQATVSKCDNQLEKLTSKMRTYILDGDTL